MKPLVNKTLAIARAEIGVRESGGANRGPRVEMFLRDTGLPGGYPWCAAYAVWSENRGAEALALRSVIPNTASCDVLLAWARSEEILFTEPEPGDLFLRLVSESDAVHTGFVDDVRAGGRFPTLEGNTNLDGSREGIGVFARERVLSRSYRFVRWSRLAPAGGPTGPVAPILSGAPAALPGPQPGFKVLFTGSGAKIDALLIGSATWAPVRIWGQKLGLSVHWDQEEQVAYLGGTAFPGQMTLIGGTAYAQVRKLAALSGLSVGVDMVARVVHVAR